MKRAPRGWRAPAALHCTTRRAFVCTYFSSCITERCRFVSLRHPHTRRSSSPLPDFQRVLEMESQQLETLGGFKKNLKLLIHEVVVRACRTSLLAYVGALRESRARARARARP